MTAAPARDLYEELAARFPHLRPNRKGEIAIPCPACGKGDAHFSFSPRGGHCFVCGYNASLYALAERIGVRGEQRPYVAPPPVVKVAAPWQKQAVEIVARSLAHPDRLARWQAYKPLTRETLDRHQFGLGTLPFEKGGRWYQSADAWLTVPLYDGDKLVGLRGRAPAGEKRYTKDGKELKWISATGTTYVLWNLPHVRPGSVCWICENYVDAAWLMERHPDYDAVALGGAAHWHDEWADALAERQPRLVIVALDNDLAGQATGALYDRLTAERVAQGKPGIPSNGPKIANSLRRAGANAVMFRWPAHAPEHADIGWLLQQEEVKE